MVDITTTMPSASTIPSAPLLRLMQLVSPALPVGAYAYSQGLEHAVHAGWVDTEESARKWILGVMGQCIATLDLPVLARAYHAWEANELEAVERWSRFLHASRETRELRDEDQHMGVALARLLTELDFPEAAPWQTRNDSSWCVLFALAAQRWSVPLQDAATGYLWSWAENQVAAAIKLVPLGQTAGQRILGRCVEQIPAMTRDFDRTRDEDIGQLAPALAIGSSLHETQYSRLFRS